MPVAGEISVIWAIEDANPRLTSLTKFGHKKVNK